MKKKLKLNSLNKIEKKNLAKVKGGNCVGCMCHGGIDTCISTDGGANNMDLPHLK
ncbi:MAG: TIGR04149 family rSAM-modified RiPP [Bacteroidales bacterium]|nr:TIGR04149 family rSAM-modified RiPP [Bacteroidales bacterium]